MIVNVTWALLLLFACCRAEDVDSVGLKEDILEGQNKVRNISNSSVKAVEETTKKLDEIKNYFQTSIPKYRAEVIIASNDTTVKMDATTKIIIGEAIDKNKPIATFNCILRVQQESEEAIIAVQKTGTNCVDDVFQTKTASLTDLQKELVLLKRATKGLYDTIFIQLQNCTTSTEVGQLVNRAEARENSLKKLVRTYEDRGIDSRIQYNEGELTCLRNCQALFNRELETCEKKMKAC